jgi:tetratricopeptide (TPR) repeat protein
VYSALSLWQDSAVDLLIWVTATSRASVLSCYAEAAAATGIQRSGDNEAVSAGFASWLRETSRPWLVVLDDLADAAALERVWPAGPSGRVLITTPNSSALSGHRALIFPVGAFSRREALTYLIGRLTTDLDQRQGAMDLVGDLGHEPLALAQASAVIASSELTCRDYGNYFAHRREQVIPAADGTPAAAAITWTLSVEHADLLSPGTAQSLLVLAALFDGNGIPSTVLTTSVAREYSGAGAAVQSTLAALEQAGLLAVNQAVTPPMAQMSWLVQAAIRAALPDGMLKGAARAAADALLADWPEDDRPEWLARSLRSCADSLRRAAGDLLWEGECHRVLLRAGRSLDTAHLTGPAVTYWEELAATSTRALGRNDPATLAIHERLARAYMATGRATESVSLFQWIWSDRAHMLGKDHPDTAEVSRQLGRALVTTSRFSDAVTVLTDAVGGYERSLGADSVEAITAREDLAAAYRAAEQFADAIKLYRRVLADRERIGGARHTDTMTTRQKLAETYLADGQAKPAMSHYERVVADRERVLGPGHLHTIAARSALGSAYHCAGRMASAVRLLEQTRAEYTQVLGPGHPDTLATCVNLAHAYYGVGRLTDAANLLQDTIERCEQSLPASDPLTVTARSSLENITGDRGGNPHP